MLDLLSLDGDCNYESVAPVGLLVRAVMLTISFARLSRGICGNCVIVYAFRGRHDGWARRRRTLLWGGQDVAEVDADFQARHRRTGGGDGHKSRSSSAETFGDLFGEFQGDCKL